ncbi:MAG: ankyrin repeat domain-containing protein [Rickettsiales bacterium]
MAKDNFFAIMASELLCNGSEDKYRKKTINHMINNWLISGDSESIDNYYNLKNQPDMIVDFDMMIAFVETQYNLNINIIIGNYIVQINSSKIVPEDLVLTIHLKSLDEGGYELVSSVFSNALDDEISYDYISDITDEDFEDDSEEGLAIISASELMNTVVTQDFSDLLASLIDKKLVDFDFMDVDGEGNSLLHFAASMGAERIFIMLLDFGMNLDALNLYNQTALELAQDNVIIAFDEYKNNLIGNSSESDNFISLESATILAPIIESEAYDSGIAQMNHGSSLSSLLDLAGFIS